MKIDKAIETLIFRSKDFILEQDPDLIEAMKLGIEALKRIQSFRTNMGSQKFWQLPGETEE